MNDESASSPDLSGIDLSLSFAPAWAKESDSSERISRLAAKHEREERPDRGPRRDGRGGGGGERRGGDRRGGPRQDRRPPREGGDKGRRHSRDHEERRPEREQAPAITGWELRFLPDRHGVEGLAKQIRSSAKAYPIFTLSRLVLDKSERYHVEFKRASEAATPLFQLKTDGSLWLNEREAAARALSAHLEKFYRREQVQVEPPKGVFNCVAVCGMSGVLLGPPNYHDYQTKLVRLHAERFANMPFEAFKSRVRMERDEATIQKWKDEQSVKDVFFPVEPEAKPKPEIDPAAENAPAPEAGEATPAEEPTAEAEVPVETAAAEVTEAAVSTENAEPAAEPVEASAESTEEAEPAAEAPASEAPVGLSFAEMEEHFRANHAKRIVMQIRERVVAPGPAALNDSAPAVLRLTRGLWEELNRFPLPLAHLLGQQLVAKGLHLFKAHENITYAGVARPHYLDRQATPVAEGLSQILDYVEAHPSVPRAEQWKALVALRPLPEGGAEKDRDAAVAADLSWLLHEGHIIDFASRGLEAARKPKPPQQPKAEKKASPRPEPKNEPAAEQHAAEGPGDAQGESPSAESGDRGELEDEVRESGGEDDAPRG
jgi:hypothetical protein